jgi:hypothetical protein
MNEVKSFPLQVEIPLSVMTLALDELQGFIAEQYDMALTTKQLRDRADIRERIQATIVKMCKALLTNKHEVWDIVGDMVIDQFYGDIPKLFKAELAAHEAKQKAERDKEDARRTREAAKGPHFLRVSTADLARAQKALKLAGVKCL